MRLYYLTTAAIAKLILAEQRLKLSLFNELNDPFELMAAGLGDNDMRRFARAVREHIAKTKGVICMSDNWRSPVMWAHYAQKHYGVCLGFDVAESNHLGKLVESVRYSPDRLKIKLDKTSHLMGMTEKVVTEMFMTKAAEWSYEREFRMMADLKEQDANGMYYVDFGPDLCLREVILGCRCEDSIGAIAKSVKVGRPPQSVRVLRARPAFNAFAMTANLAVKAINVPGAK